ncbi:pancreatic triacylglycerol lipase-like [Ostrinia furnacalis]|uniref:pancreatic triacylglycerol lipase-like n=1 Tax=Ostrinia furnacalis TaxID=93504 RepID=UPI00103C344B|nr:pancreatic triacylglycerol lipase-like [Ostrinia furnacalis]
MIISRTMARSSLILLLFGLAAVLAFPPQGKDDRRPSWWPAQLPWPPSHPESIPWPPTHPESIPWPPTHPESIPWPPSHPESIPWPPQKPSWWPENIPWPTAAQVAEAKFTDKRPSWLPENVPWPLQKPEKPERPSWWPASIPWPSNAEATSDSKISHPERIPWPPTEWFPEDAPWWWPSDFEWPPAQPEWIPWPPQIPEWIPWPPSHPEWIPWPPQIPEWIPWPPQIPEIPWPPQIPEWIPWPPTHPEGIPWPPTIPSLPYNPIRDNQFHLFTRANPQMSQPLVYQNANLLASTNYDASRPTKVLVHDIAGAATSQFNAILVPAILAAADVNIIVVDWSRGANESSVLSTAYSAASGVFNSRFISWLSTQSRGDLANFHLIGVGLGALNVGFIGRLLDRKVGYITALDPSQGPSITSILPPLNPKVAQYTEVIHTDAGQSSYTQPLGDADFYPNGGSNMPGCAGDSACNRLRAVYYFAESVRTGGFTGVQCSNFQEALEGNCEGPETLNMGGLNPKTGSSGVYHLTTNAASPFSQG